MAVSQQNHAVSTHREVLPSMSLNLDDFLHRVIEDKESQ